jgi:amino acid adenylation domain-containing protein
MTYGRLETLSDALARVLAALGCTRGDRVALMMPKSPMAVASVLGIYKAGGIVVPLDPECPVARLERIMGRAECAWVLAAGGRGVSGALEELARAPRAPFRVGWLGRESDLLDRELDVAFIWRVLAEQPPGPPAVRRRSGAPAHILFTSGSTGEPKGVIVTHASVRDFVEWAVGHYGIGCDDRLSCHSPLHFDLSTFDLFGAFAAGAELHLVPPELNLFPYRLAAWIRESALTQWFSVPSILAYMTRFDAVRPGDFPSLRRLLWCGEVFPTPALLYWMERLPHVAFSNLYGPTETTIASSYHDLSSPPEDERATVPIGRPCAGEELLVLGPDGEPRAPGEVGELHIRGAGVCPGYWNDPERTAAAFLPDRTPGNGNGTMYATGDLAWRDAEGVFHFVGRVDSQIKSRGYRIELGEVESAVAALGSTREVVVTAIGTGGFEGQSICCAFVPSGGRGTDPAELRRQLSRLLPAYMLPERWARLARLPRNGNGKLDRRRIREMFAAEEARGDDAIQQSC